MKHKQIVKSIFGLIVIFILVIAVFFAFFEEEIISNNVEEKKIEIETVDTNINWLIEFMVDSKNNGHIIYYKDDGIYYAHLVKGKWNVDILHSDCEYQDYPSFDVDNNGYLHMVYMDRDNKTIKHMNWTGSYWNIDIIDKAYYPIISISLDVDNLNNVHICYYIKTSYSYGLLKYAKWEGDNWEIEILDQNCNESGYPIIQIDQYFSPHIFYIERGKIKHFKWTNSKWELEKINLFQNFLGSNAIEINSQNNPVIGSYNDKSNRQDFAYWTGMNWNINKSRSLENMNGHSYWILDSKDFPHLSYFDSENNKLNYIKWNGGNWSYETVHSYEKKFKFKKNVIYPEDANYDTMCINRLVLDLNDNPHICYFFSEWNIKSNLYYAKYVNDQNNGISNSIPAFEGFMTIIIIGLVIVIQQSMQRKTSLGHGLGRSQIR